jgi:hypothetical protein
MATQYTVRTESAGENNGFLCWIDRNGDPVICQPNEPHLSNQGNFATAEIAQAWGDKHVEGLSKIENEAEAMRIKTAEREEAAYQANLALVAILEKLTNPTA